ncbi:MAG TPA: hypothetical protein VMJ35_13920 [Dongiaceae bacterium]|nr:hypothetical protein [Dongiaceae bacterium]
MSTMEKPVKVEPGCEDAFAEQDLHVDKADDMYDEPKEMEGHGMLASALQVLTKEVSRPYWGYNWKARRTQTWHRRITNVAIFTGTLAVALAILQLPLPGLSLESKAQAMPYVETLAAIAAFVSVSWGLLQSIQKHWLLQRHKAEQLRFLKYTTILKLARTGVDTRSMAWAEEIKEEVRRICAIDESDLLRWRNDGPQRDVRSKLEGKATLKSGKEFAQIEEYYKGKRLEKQINYFMRSANKALARDWLTKYPPLILFIASVFCAASHLLISNIEAIREPLGKIVSEPFLGAGLIIMSALLPVFGAAIRTYRSANEFSRNSVRFGAVYHTLDRISKSLAPEMAPERKLELLAQCEQTLEDEHREWFRLMDEAEWYG